MYTSILVYQKITTEPHAPLHLSHFELLPLTGEAAWRALRVVMGGDGGDGAGYRDGELEQACALWLR